MTKAVLFDLDHTLYDRDATLLRLTPPFVERFLCRFHSRPVDERAVADALIAADKLNYIGWPATYEELADGLPWDPPGYEAFREFMQAYLGRCATPYPDTHDVLRRCAGLGLDIGVVTNGSKEMQNEKIDTLGIRPYMKCIVISGEAGVQKPDPAVYALAAKAIGHAPEDIAFVGDNPLNDVIGPEAAGMTGIWLDHFSDWPEGRPKPSHVAHRLGEVVGMLETMRG